MMKMHTIKSYIFNKNHNYSPDHYSSTTDKRKISVLAAGYFKTNGTKFRAFSRSVRTDNTVHFGE